VYLLAEETEEDAIKRLEEEDNCISLTIWEISKVVTDYGGFVKIFEDDRSGEYEGYDD